MAAMLSASATFTTRARVTCKPRAARTAVRAAATKTPAGVKSRSSASSAESVEWKDAAKTVLSGVAASSIASIVAPFPAAALSITDPVFGDIQVWQFIVLTAGYWLGIEYYLDNKYDEKEQSPDSIMPKVYAAKKNSFAEAKAEQEAKEAESAE